MTLAAAVLGAALVVALAFSLIDRARADRALERARSSGERERERMRTAFDLQAGVIREEHRDELLERDATHRAELERIRSEYRELLNRFQHPQVMPTGTRPMSPVEQAQSEKQRSVRDRARAAWNTVGTVTPAAAPNGTPGTVPADEVGSELP